MLNQGNSFVSFFLSLLYAIIIFLELKKQAICGDFELLAKDIVELVCIWIISIVIHEVGHCVVAKKHKYNLYCIRGMGIQFLIGHSYHRCQINTRGDFLLNANILFDYVSKIDTEEKLECFYKDFKKIILGGPCATMLLFLVSILLKSMGLEEWGKWTLLINSMIFISSCFSGKTEINDIDLLIKYKKYRENIFIWLCLNTGIQEESTFILKKKRSFIYTILEKQYGNVYECIFLCNYLWKMYENKKLDLDILDECYHRGRDIKFENIYFYYTFIIILAICYSTVDLEKAKKLALFTKQQKGIMYVLKQNTSGVAYFTYVMEREIFNKNYHISKQQYIKAMRKIGIIL